MLTFIRLNTQDHMYEIYRNNMIYGVASTIDEAHAIEDEAKLNERLALVARHASKR